MDYDSELIGIKPSKDGTWEVNGHEGLTLEAALREVEAEMRAWRPEPEVVTVMTEEQIFWNRNAMRLALRLAPVFADNPYMNLFEPKSFQYEDEVK